MTRVISVVSGKGGVGKTTVTSNLAIALASQGEETLIIDGNLSGANVAQHFGLGFQEVSLNHVLDGQAYITQAVAKHPAGVSILPASILEFETGSDQLKHSLVEFLGDKDYVLIDAAAGINEEVEAAIEASDEVLLVSEPELPSLTNCLGAKKLAEELDREVIGVVLNNVREEKSEVTVEDAEELLNTKVIGEIPEHKDVRKAIALREPVRSLKPVSSVSKSIDDTAHKLKGNEPPERSITEKFAIKLDQIINS